jgi:DNA repair and recombination protein RAD54B
MDEDEDELSDGPVQPARRPLSKSCATPSKGPSREHILRQNETIAGADRYYLCYWRKPQGRKHKTWDGDAVLIVKGGGKCTLRCTQSFRE